MNLKNIKKCLFLSMTVLIVSYIFINTALAGPGLGSWGSYLDEASGQAGYYTGESDKGTVEGMIAVVIQTALTFLGVVFLILAIYGGYLWMTARGNEEQLTRAKNTLTAAVVGLIIVIGAYAISYFVIERLSKGTLEG